MLLSEIGIYFDDKIIDIIINYELSNNNKEILRKEWWKIWYKIIIGYNSYSENTNRKKKVITITDINGGGIGNKMTNLFTSITNRVSNTAPSRSTTTQISTVPSRSTATQIINTIPSTKINIEEDAINNLLSTEKEYYLEYADKEQKDLDGYTEYDYEILYFDFAKSNANEIIIKSQKKRQALSNKLRNNMISVNEIVCNYNPSKIIPYPDRYGFNTIFQLVNDNPLSHALYMYGMQLPHQFDREGLLYSFIYLFHLKIYNIVDLHDCEGGTNKQNSNMAKGIGCNPYDRKCEWSMYEEAKRLTITQPEKKCEIMPNAMNLSDDLKDTLILTQTELEYLKEGSYYNIPIMDMTAGYMGSWELISKIKDTSKAENSISIHCLAGKGRTGSVMLYLMLRDFCKIFKDEGYNSKNVADLKRRLALPNFDYKNIIELVDGLKVYFTLNGYTTNTEAVIIELFKLSCTILDRKTINLLKQKGVDIETINSIIKRGLDNKTIELLLAKTVDQNTINTIKSLEFKSHAIASLLRQRLNRIFFFLAREFNVNEFYTYMRPTIKVLNLPYDEFSNPQKHTIRDWNNFNRDDVYTWVN
jgi:hypothetical protein